MAETSEAGTFEAVGRDALTNLLDRELGELIVALIGGLDRGSSGVDNVSVGQTGIDSVGRSHLCFLNVSIESVPEKFGGSRSDVKRYYKALDRMNVSLGLGEEGGKEGGKEGKRQKRETAEVRGRKRKDGEGRRRGGEGERGRGREKGKKKKKRKKSRTGGDLYEGGIRKIKQTQAHLAKKGSVRFAPMSCD